MALSLARVKRVELELYNPLNKEHYYEDISHMVHRVSLDASPNDITTVTLTIPACYVRFNGQPAVTEE